MDFRAHPFRPLTGHRIHAQQLGMPNANFTVAVMFTELVRDKVERIKPSLDRTGLNYVIYQVPSIHNSLSAKGGDDITFCKPNFIHAMLQEWGPAILCVDADIVFREFPVLISKLAAQGTEFAVYNWLADETNDAYMPVEVPFEGYGNNRFYQYSHGVDFFDPNQLVNSGAVHFYGRSDATTALLSLWLKATIEHPRVPDDQILNHVYNFLGRPNLKHVWLDKAHCRYAWWITAKPIIDHPDFSNARDVTFESVTGKPMFDRQRARQRLTSGPFPRNRLIDTETKRILRMPPPDQWIATPINQELWLSREE